MLVSLDWIKDFVKLPDVSPTEFANRFTMATAEVEEVKVEGDYWEKIRIAEITHIEKHPNAEKLNLVSFKLGEGENFRVVCGASNVKVGLRVAFAPIGTTLPVGFTLEPKKIRGILSEGMLCSKEELGLEESSDGIWELPVDATLGISLKEYLGAPADVILDIDNKSLTHRPDLWGHYGMAREVATFYEQNLKDPFDQQFEQKIDALFTGDASPMKINVDSNSSSLGYFGVSVDGVEIKESPAYMQNRLRAVGLRPINNIVDVSNYIMLELGMPMHIFDREQIEGDTVFIKQLEENTEFITLDEVKRDLHRGDTVIADKNKPLVIAGIMGGLNSGVTDKTSQIFIEVANWKAKSVRETSTRLGLRTDSSMRYEKSLDSLLLKRTMYRAIELVLELCPDAKVVGKLEYDGPDLSSIAPLHISTSYKKITTTLGIDIDNKRIDRILTNLGFKLVVDGDCIDIEVPSFRATKDVEYEADIIEEIGRMVGYDNIPIASPRLDIAPVELSVAQKLHKKIKNYLVFRHNSYELMSYPLVGAKLLDKVGWSYSKDLKLVNALSVDAELMRPSLIPQAIQTVVLNQKNYEQFRFFELGRSYLPNNQDFAKEQSHMLIGYFSKTQNQFMELMNSVDELIRYLGLPADIIDRHPKFQATLVDEQWKGIHPYEFKNIRLMGKMEGNIFSLHPYLLKQMKIKGFVSFMVLNLTPLERKAMKEKISYSPLPKFPSSTFDWTVEMRRGQEVGELFKALNKVKLKEMKSLRIVDEFKRDEVTFITLSALFIDPEKTLSSDFLNNAKEKLISASNNAGFPLKS